MAKVLDNARYEAGYTYFSLIERLCKLMYSLRAFTHFFHSRYSRHNEAFPPEELQVWNIPVFSLLGEMLGTVMYSHVHAYPAVSVAGLSQTLTQN